MGYNFKDNYLNELRKALSLVQISTKEIDEIVADYSELYDEAKSSGYNDEDIYNKLGNPSDIAKELNGSFVENFNPYSKKHRKNWLVSTSPIVATVVFLVIGFVWKLWHPGWLAFMWVPISGILFGNKRSFISKLSSLSVFIALISFIVLGYFEYWHPGWIVWLLVPLCGAISGTTASIDVDRKKWLVKNTANGQNSYFRTHKEATDFANRLLNDGYSVKIEKID